MNYQVIHMIRQALKVIVYATLLLFLAGFIAQFVDPVSYGWAATVRGYTSGVQGFIQSFLPTVYSGVNFALLVALILLWIIYSRIDHALWLVEDTARRQEGGAKRQTANAPFVPPAARAATPKEPGRSQAQPAAAAGSDATPGAVHRSEAIAVIDLCGSTDLITRFGNSFLLSVKHRIQQHAGPISARHEAFYSDFTGDGYLTFFPTVPKALAALQEIMSRVPALNNDLPTGAEIALRAALNFGEVLIDRDTMRTGSAIHKTFRLEALGGANLIEAKGGVRREEFPEKNYILVSEEAMTILQKIQGVQCRFLGHCELKGFPGIHRIYKA